MAKSQTQLQLVPDLGVFNVKFNSGTRDVEYFLCKPTYPVKRATGFTKNNLIDSGKCTQQVLWPGQNED